MNLVFCHDSPEILETWNFDFKFQIFMDYKAKKNKTKQIGLFWFWENLWPANLLNFWGKKIWKQITSRRSLCPWTKLFSISTAGKTIWNWLPNKHINLFQNSWSGRRGLFICKQPDAKWGHVFSTKFGRKSKRDRAARIYFENQS
jgi:hypothetical protein